MANEKPAGAEGKDAAARTTRFPRSRAGAAERARMRESVRDVQFAIAVRGYDRGAVDRYVEQVNRLIAELEISSSPDAVIRAALDEVSEETRGRLQRAQEHVEFTHQHAREPPRSPTPGILEPVALLAWLCPRRRTDSANGAEPDCLRPRSAAFAAAGHARVAAGGDHLAWFVLEAVEELDLDAFYAAYRDDGQGAAAHDPAMMVALLLYAYAVGESSTRSIERRTIEEVA